MLVVFKEVGDFVFLSLISEFYFHMKFEESTLSRKTRNVVYKKTKFQNK